MTAPKHPLGYEHVRRVIFQPRRKGAGPRFILDLWDAEQHDSAGRWPVAYRLRMVGESCERCGGKGIIYNPGKGWDPCPAHAMRRVDVVLFESDRESLEYEHTAVDSDKRVAGVMNWLTLRPGDTDADYFKDYTPEQLAFCDQHAEALACEVFDRFGEV